MQRPKIQDLALGKWQDILPKLGIDAKFLKNKHGPCPICAGTDRFRWDNRSGSGSFICTHCGSGGGVDLVMKFKQWDFITARTEIEKIVPSAKVHIPKAYQDGDLQSRMMAAWQQSSPIRQGDVVSKWLASRGLILDKFPSQLRFSVNTPYSSGSGAKSYFPAMIAKFVAPDLSSITLHRTFLDEDGNKASVDDVRMLAPGKVPAGGAVRLAQSGDILGVAEGIETAIAASILFKIPVWACLTAAFLQKWEPPKTVKRVVIFGDNDLSCAGQAAAWGLAYRLKSNFEVEVRLPDNPGEDFNDVLCNDLGIEKPSAHKHKELSHEQILNGGDHVVY